MSSGGKGKEYARLCLHLGHPLCCDAHEPLRGLHDGVWRIPPVEDEALRTHVVLDLCSYHRQTKEKQLCVYERCVYLIKEGCLCCTVLRWR